MPDTELMDQVMKLITAVPALHDQTVVACSLAEADQRLARRQLGHADPEVARLVPDCASAFCVGGWVLTLRGYWYDTTVYRWVGPGGVRLVSPPLLSLAAQYLGIPVAEARSGILCEDSTLGEIQLWVDYYKGKIDRDDLEYRLARPDA